MLRSLSWSAFLLALCLAAGCEDASAPAERPLLQDDDENLLTLTRGAAVVERTGELSLETSPLLAIDTDPRSWWGTPPGDPEESAVFSFPGTTELRRVGISSGTVEGVRAVGAVRFESSLDGSRFTPLAEVRLDEHGEAAVDVPPTPALYLRATTLESIVPEAAEVRVATLRAWGSKPALRPRPRIAGSWSINGVAATFESEGSTLRGILHEDPPWSIEGGWDGPLIRFTWARGPQRGVGAATLDPDGRAISALVWYLRPDPPFFGTAWYGSRADGPAEPAGGLEPPAAVFLRHDGRVPLYGLEFRGGELTDGSAPAVRELAAMLRARAGERVRLVAHEVGTVNAEIDRRTAAAKLAALEAALGAEGVDLAHVEFVASGRREAVEAPDRPWTPLQVILNNRIDLVLDQPTTGGGD